MSVEGDRYCTARDCPMERAIDQLARTIGRTRHFGKQRDALVELDQRLNGCDLRAPAGDLRLALVRAAEIQDLFSKAVHLAKQDESFVCEIRNGDSTPLCQCVTRWHGQE